MSLVTTYFVTTTYFVLPDLFCIKFDLFCITNLFCSKIALFCIIWPTYFTPTDDLIFYKKVVLNFDKISG